MYEPNYHEIIEQIGTPSYVFDIDILKDRILELRKALGNQVHLCYAMKANAFIVDRIINEIDRYEVCSPGEFKICERAGIPMEKVVLSGVYKEQQDMLRIISLYREKIMYTCESVNQFHMINEIAKEQQIVVNVLLRITTGNQFGMDESELMNIIAKRSEYTGVCIRGIQHFSGTQRKRLSKYEEELNYVDNLITKLKAEYGFETEELEFGPGFYVEYFQDAKANPEDLVQGFAELLKNMNYKGHITLELGRFIASSCGKYYTSVVDMKKNHSTTFCIMNGGIHQMNYFGQMMAMKIPYYRQLKKVSSAESNMSLCNICGSLCTVNDNLVKNLPLANPEIGDILEFYNVGAYSVCEGISLFLSRDLPKVYIYDKQTGMELQRDTIETNMFNHKQ